MKRIVATLLAAAFFALAPSAVPAATSSASEKLLSKMEWRLAGPYIGGRVVAVAGVPSDPNLFYMGGVQGGVWKSDNAGNSWDNITDGKMGKISHSIGAIAVAPSDAKIIYVGTGESDIRGDWENGEGIYKSTNAGETWQYAGLRETRQTSSIVIDPRNPNIVYATSMGHVFKPNADRGVYKTVDGGKTWRKVLFVDDNTGANNIVMDAKNSNVLYATMWQAQRTEWTLTSGGPGSAIYKTTDAGKTWKKISTNPGFATGMLGKMGVAVAPNNSNVVYAVVQQKTAESFGRITPARRGRASTTSGSFVNARSTIWRFTSTPPTGKSPTHPMWIASSRRPTAAARGNRSVRVWATIISSGSIRTIQRF